MAVTGEVVIRLDLPQSDSGDQDLLSRLRQLCQELRELGCSVHMDVAYHLQDDRLHAQTTD